MAEEYKLKYAGEEIDQILDKAKNMSTKYVPVKGQLSYDGSKFSAPYHGTAILHIYEKTIDIHVSCLIEEVKDIEGSKEFGYFSLNDILQKCGIYSIKEEQSTVLSTATPYGNQSGLDNMSLTGRSGLTLDISYQENSFSIGRCYNDNMDVGGWPVRRENLIIPGRGYIFNIYGLQYNQ